jgi:hypothetical protein
MFVYVWSCNKNIHYAISASSSAAFASSQCSLFITSPLMPIVVQTLTAVNGVIVPFERDVVDLLDPDNLSDGSRDNVEFDRVALTGSGSHSWLCHAVGFIGNSQQWHRRAGSLPLFQEMRARILDHKKALGANCRTPRQPQAAIAIKVREHVLIIKNCTRRVTLMMPLHPASKIEPLQWLLNQIVIDLAKPAEAAGDAADLAETQSATASAGDFAETQEDTQETFDDTEPGAEPQSALVEKTIADAVIELRGLGHDTSACWAPSRHAFRIASKKASGVKEFRVQGWAKRHRQAGQGNEQLLIAAIAEAKDAAAHHLASEEH